MVAPVRSRDRKFDLHQGPRAARVLFEWGYDQQRAVLPRPRAPDPEADPISPLPEVQDHLMDVNRQFDDIAATIESGAVKFGERN